MRYKGDLKDLTQERDPQDVMRATVQHNVNRVIDTTVGRVILNDRVAKGLPFFNGTLKKKGLQSLVNYCHLRLGHPVTVKMLDDLKNLGFQYATRAGISIGIDDLVTPDAKKTLVGNAETEVIEVDQQYRDGVITNGERYNKVIAIWSEVTDKVAKEMFKAMDDKEKATGELNPILVMSDSGARGTAQQIRQLAGMRGLMARPSGEIIETPIHANFREGLNVFNTSSRRTARVKVSRIRLSKQPTPVTSHVVSLTWRRMSSSANPIAELCAAFTRRQSSRAARKSRACVIASSVARRSKMWLTRLKVASSSRRIVRLTKTLQPIFKTPACSAVRMRSVLTCESRRGCCILCYGRNLASGKHVDIGEAVGVIAAQSIGEPGTQLTMRTFHIGGTARLEESSKHEARVDGTIRYLELQTVMNRQGERVAMNRNGAVTIHDERGREVARHQIVYGAKVLVGDGDRVQETNCSRHGTRSRSRFSRKSRARSPSRI
jgi:DNA-directed RNA polymerase subunit beta'